MCVTHFCLVPLAVLLQEKSIFLNRLRSLGLESRRPSRLKMAVTLTGITYHSPISYSLILFWLFWTIGPLQQVYTLSQRLSSLALVVDRSFSQPYVRRYCCCCPVGQIIIACSDVFFCNWQFIVNDTLIVKVKVGAIRASVISIPGGAYYFRLDVCNLVQRGTF